MAKFKSTSPGVVVTKPPAYKPENDYGEGPQHADGKNHVNPKAKPVSHKWGSDSVKGPPWPQAGIPVRGEPKPVKRGGVVWPAGGEDIRKGYVVGRSWRGRLGPSKEASYGDGGAEGGGYS